MSREDISVIIPTLNEVATLETTLARLLKDRPREIIVVDGGSEDATRELAAKWSHVIRTAPGRAVQQNRGARVACGEILLFLHADCWPEPGWQNAVRSAARRRDFVAGCFRMRIAGERLMYRAIERGGDLRVRWLGLPYGDQGIFLRRDKFFQLGMFPDVGFMEDLMFMRQARRIGRVELLDHPIHVSPRRWEREGLLRQTLRNWTLTALATIAEVAPERLAKFYPPVR